MPAPGDQALRLAKRLVQLGKLLGLEASSEHPVAEKSRLRVDVLWRKKMPPGCLIRDVNMISFEIQYSRSQHSVSHNILKAKGTLHPSRHYVISYSRLSDDYIKNVLKANFPKDGLEIVNGEAEVRDFECMIEKFVTSKTLRNSLAEDGKEVDDLLSSQLRGLSRQEIERIVHETLPKIERPIIASRLLHNHLRLLAENLEASRGRLNRLYQTWTRRADEGVLPHLCSKGAFDIIKNRLDFTAEKLSFFSDTRLGRYTRLGFEDIIELLDDLRNIHGMLSILERLYWQRTDGYIPHYGSKESIIEATRFKANKQVFDAADALCASYWNSVFSGTEESTWVGFSVFDQYYEFRRWNELVFAPSFSRRYLGRNWMYFSHEVAHQAIDRLMEKEQFVELHQSLVRIFSKFSSLFQYTTPEYLAFEVESDILATLISGEQYITVLTDLKYYPSFTVFSRRNFLGRAIRCPVLMRVLVCSFTARLAWGLGEHTNVHFAAAPKEQVLSRAIKSVREEDLFARSIILLLLEKRSEDLKKLVSTEQSIVSIHKSLEQVLNYLEILEMVIIPNVIKMILEERIIQRLKRFAKYDFYSTSSDSCYCDVNMTQVDKVKRLVDLENEFFIKTPEAGRIRKLVASKIKLLERISSDIEHKKMTTGEPRDMVACLSSLQEKTGFNEELSQIALASILGRKQ